MKNLLKAYRLIDAKDRWIAWVVLVTVTVMAFFETLGTVSIMPFLAVLANPALIESNATLSWIRDLSGVATQSGFLILLGICSFTLLVVSALVRSFGFWFVNSFTQTHTFGIGVRLMETYLRQPYAFFLNRHSGDLAKELLSEVNMLVAQVYQPAVALVAQSILLVVLVSLLVAVNPVVALVGVAVLGSCYAVIFMTVRARLAWAGRRRARLNQLRYRVVAEALGGIKQLKLLGREHIYHDRFADHSREFGRILATTTSMGAIPRYLIEAIAFGGIILLALFLMVQYQDAQNGALTHVLPLLGFYAFSGYRILPAVQGIYQALSMLKIGVPVVDGIAKGIELGEGLPALHRLRPEPLPFTRTVTIEDLGFRYPLAERASLEGLSLTITPGSSLGVVGSTGAGKTTFIDLFLGLLAPSSGRIVVDGIPVTEDNTRAWQADLGYVPQDIFLMDTSVAGNIAMGLPKAQIDMARVREAARMAQILDFIETQMPQGFDTEVGERGVRLSGGQRQRIGIARALYANPSVIVFDEATSALDNLTEQEVVKAINAISGTKTIVLIAHRISTVKNCDQILVLERGRMVGLGSYDALYATNETFRRLVDARDAA